MKNTTIFQMPFSKLYQLYIAKALRKSRTKAEVDEIICWLTGYDLTTLNQFVEGQSDIFTFFEHAQNYNIKAELIKGSICGVKIDEIQDPLMKKIRCLDKLIDDLAKGKSLDKILF